MSKESEASSASSSVHIPSTSLFLLFATVVVAVVVVAGVVVMVTSEATVVVAALEAMVVVAAGAFGSAVVVVPVTVAAFSVIVVVVKVVVVVVVVVVVMIMQFGHFDGAFQLPPFPHRGLMSESGKRCKVYHKKSPSSILPRMALLSLHVQLKSVNSIASVQLQINPVARAAFQPITVALESMKKSNNCDSWKTRLTIKILTCHLSRW